MAGRPAFDAVIAGPRFTNSDFSSGERAESCWSVGLSSRAAGRSCVMSGFVCSENAVRRLIVVADSRSNVGRAWKICWRSAFRAAVVAKTRLLLETRPRSCPWRSLRAEKTVPVLRTTPRTVGSWPLRILTRTLVSSTNGRSVPKASLRSRPRPVMATAWVCIQSWKASRVLASKARKISSSSTVDATRPAASRPPSGMALFAVLCPGLSST